MTIDQFVPERIEQSATDALAMTILIFRAIFYHSERLFERGFASLP
jgi:hypothetical protein